MIRFVNITRLYKLLPLVEESSPEDEKIIESSIPDYKFQCKSVIRSMSPQEPLCTFESGNFNFHLLLDQGIVYLCIADRLYAKKNAFSFLEKVSTSFYQAHGNQVESIQRPYGFLSFQNELSKLRKASKDASEHTQASYDQLYDRLGAVHKVLTKNIHAVMQRGEQLDRLSSISSNLTTGCKKFSRESQNLKWNSMIDKYGTPLVMVILVILIIFLWYCWF